MDDLTGLWTRSLIAWPDGRRDQTTRAHWLQAQSRFADLRQPETPGHTVVAGCLEALSMADCLALATQQAFAGVFIRRDHGFEWVRQIDLQPGRAPDIGRLSWHGDVLVEEGLGSDYTEHWHRAEAARLPCAALSLEDREDGRRGSLIRVGNHFMYARDRLGLATGADLAAAVAGAASLAAARALLDVEISFGHVSGDHWRITRSSLPFRQDLDLPRRGQGSAGLLIAEHDAGGGTTTRAWTIVAAEGEAACLLDRVTAAAIDDV